MEYILQDKKPIQNTILCCECGTSIEPNPANMCVACIRTKVDITEGIIKQGNLQWCKGCLRYLNHNNQYIICQPESKELLSICLKKLKGLNHVRLIDAVFIWTEPHSKRIKIKLTIQKEVNGGAILQQSLPIEFIVMNQMCDDCHKREAKDFWKAVVQIRQKADNKKTFYYLEQLLLKHNVTSHILNIKQEHGGLDFYFSTKDDAKKFAAFIENVIPCRQKYSQRLISHDIHSNIFNYKSTFSLELIPVSKDSLVCFSGKLASSLGLPNRNRIAICCKLTKSAHFVDPLSGQTFEINATQYSNMGESILGFEVLCSANKLGRFVVMEIEEDRAANQNASQVEDKYQFSMAACWVTKDTDQATFGSETYFCRTHLGNILKPGDFVLGLHLPSCNLNNKYLEEMKESDVPEVLLVKKVYPDEDKSKRLKHARNSRKSKLNLSDQDASVDTQTCVEDSDYNEVLETLEEINLEGHSRGPENKSSLTMDMDDAENSSRPKLSLQKMLEDFHMD
ncbi:unnamed protein product [Gordionus sp. m RMFG-2023]